MHRQGNFLPLSPLQLSDLPTNLCARDDKDEEEDVHEVQRPMGMDIAKKKGVTSTKSSTSSNEDALARLMVNEAQNDIGSEASDQGALRFGILV
nr:hypothetical protein [Tanacetum cinerariifolium]